MAAPYFSTYDAISVPNGTWIKPGGQVAAYVRSTGVQSGDLPEVAGNLVSTINLGLARCRAGMNDIVYVLPGHTETHSVTGAIWPNLVAGAQIISAGSPRAANNANVTLSHAGASVALNAANVSVVGLNINSATAALTAAIVVTAAGVTMERNFISFTGALAANPGVAVTAVAGFSFRNNSLAISCTDPMLEVTGASTDLEIVDNYFRLLVSGGTYVNIAATGSGLLARNFGKSFGAAPTGADGFVISAPTLVGNFENYVAPNTAAQGVIADGT